MTKNNTVFAILLIGPSAVLYVLGYATPTPCLDSLSAMLTLAAVTLCPWLGALFFERLRAITLCLLIPFVLICTKSLSFDGAERLVVAGLLVSVVFSVISCAFGLAVKYLYAKYYPRTI